MSREWFYRSRPFRITIKTLAIFLLVLLLWPASATWAKPTTAEQAQRVVNNWLSLDWEPLGAILGQQVIEVETFRDESGNPVYYVAYLNPVGFVFVPADDLVEPIIGFLPKGKYDPSPENPLGALVSQDVPGRVAWVRELEDQALARGIEFTPVGRQQEAQHKWELLDRYTPPRISEFGIPSVSDVWVPPLVQSKWSQSTECGNYCYNYYTPNYYVCGCVATAQAQLMRYWSYPITGPGTPSFTIYVNGVPQTRGLRGGNGSGGPYSWTNMVLDPGCSTTLTQRQAIGALTHDTGVSVNMNYTSSGSGADTLKTADSLVNTFGYSNAKKGYNSGNNLPATNRNNMVNPNLDAAYPILFGITGGPGGHAIVGDGYGYNTSTLYHHLNMGWAGTDDAWYNLPTIGTHLGTFTSVYKCVYNVYTSGSGEIISGRVVDSGGGPISGADVTASRTGGGTYNTTTNIRGIYALKKIPSNSTYTINVSKTGYNFNSQTVSTGTSTNMSTTTGNRWGIDFTPTGSSITLNEALDNNDLNFTTGGNATWFGQTATSHYDGDAAQSGAITDTQSSWVQTTVTGPGILTFYWKVSSEAIFDYLRFYIDGVEQSGSISGDVDWQQKTYSIASGSHTLKWAYTKDFCASSGSDAGWLDKVALLFSDTLIPCLELLLLDD